LCTLRFAQKAKKVVNKPVINLDAKSKIIIEMKNQINHLKEIIGHSEYKEYNINYSGQDCALNV